MLGSEFDGDGGPFDIVSLEMYLRCISLTILNNDFRSVSGKLL